MKKLLSILLAACMLLTMLSLPAVAAEAVEGTYVYHKFDFDVDNFLGYTNTRTTLAAGTGLRKYTAVVAGDAAASTEGPSTGEAVAVDYVEYGGKTVMRIRYNSTRSHASNYRTNVIPHYKDASGNFVPVRFEEGKSYSFKYNLVAVRFGGCGNSNNRIFTELWPNTAAYGFRNVDANSNKWSSAAMVGGKKLSAGTLSTNHANYVPVSGLYAPITHSQTGMGYDTNYAGFAVTDTQVYTIDGETVTAETTAANSKYGVNGSKSFPVTVPKVDMLPLNDPDEDTEGDFDDLGDWGIEWKANAAGTGMGAYTYKLYGASEYHYTDAVAISLPAISSNNRYFEVDPADVNDLPFPDQVVTIGDKTYARLYNEFYLTDFEYYEAGKGAINFVAGETTATMAGAVGDTVTAPAAPAVEGKEFLGWYDAEGNKFVDGTAIVTGAPATYTARYASYTDNFKIDGKDIVFNATNDVAGTTVKSDLSMIVAENDYYRITPVYSMLHKWADDVEIPYKSVAPALKRATATIGTKIGLPNTPADTEVGTLKMVSTTGANSQVSTLLDASGAPLLAKSNTEYMVKLAYKQLGAGTVRVRVGAGRSTAYATSGINVAALESTRYQNISEVSGTAFNAKFKTLGAVSLDYSEDVQYAFFNFATGDFGTGYIPEFNITTSTDGVLGRYTGKHYADVPTNPNNASDKWGSSNWGQYEIVGLPEFEIQSIEIIEVESGNSVVVYNDGDTMVEGVKGAELIPDNFEKTVYKTAGNTRESNKLKVFPEDNSFVYDYNDVLENVKYTQRTYIGCRGFAIDEAENALFYKPYTYDEYYDKYGVDIISSAALGEGVSLTGDQKLAKLKQAYESSIWNMYRLPIEETVDGATYKVTFSYKNEGEIPATLCLALGKLESVVDSEQQVLAETKVIAKTDEYTTATMFFTIEHSAMVTANVEGADDTHEALGKYLYVYFNHSVADVNQTGRPEVYLKDIVVENLGTVVGIPGASCLTEDAAEAASQQAMRVYFSYKSTTGSNIFIDDVEYEVLERGIIYANGAIDKYTTVGGTEGAPTYKYYGGIKVGNGYTTYAKSENLDTAWAYEEATQELWYSNYIRNFRAGMENYKVLARGYIKFTDGENEYIVYSNTVNRSIEYLKDNCTDKIEEF